MRPLVRDLNIELEERLARLRPIQELVIIKGYRGKRLSAYGFSDPQKDMILRNFVRLMQSFYKPFQVTSEPQVTLVDKDGNNRTVTMWRDVVNVAFVDPAMIYVGSILSFGNPTSTPTPARTDYEIDTKVAEVTPSATTIDETSWRVNVTGSYVWVAGGTVRCAGFYIRGNRRVSPTEPYTFLMYYDAVDDVVIDPNGTVSITYITQF